MLEGNHKARKFYERHGFAFDGNVREFENGIGRGDRVSKSFSPVKKQRSVRAVPIHYCSG